MLIGIVGRKGRIGELPNGSAGIIPEPDDHPVGLTINRIIESLKQEMYEYRIDVDTINSYPNVIKETCYNLNEIAKTVDVIIVVGGDGTLLDIARQTLGYNVPLIGVNQGRVGFITDIPSDKAPETIIKMLRSNEYTVEMRTLLDMTGMDSRNAYLKSEIALNDIVFSKRGGRIIEYEVYLGQRGQEPKFAYKARADGLIIATPTGSTAYALAAGGSIINPTSRVIQIIPMLPQTLAYSPLIVDDSFSVKFKLISGEADAWVDGQGPFDIGKDGMSIVRSTDKIIFWHPDTKDVTYDYFNTLRQKLNWQLEPGTK